MLDLVLIDVPDCKAKPCAAVSDHKGALTQVKITVTETISHQREVLHFAGADWDGLISNIQDTDWEFLSSSTTSEGGKRMTETLLEFAEDNIHDEPRQFKSPRIRA